MSDPTDKPLSVTLHGEDETPLTSPTNPMQMIGIAARTGAQPEALEKLMALQERFEANEARKAFTEAFISTQAEMPVVRKTKKGAKGDYAPLEDIMRILGPILTRNKLALSYSQTDAKDTITVLLKITHLAGHSETCPFTLPKDEVIKSKEGRDVTNLAQMQGSANSYARRYCLQNAFDIVVGDHDDDAKALNAPIKTVSDAQAKELKALCDTAEVKEEKFLVHFRAESFQTIALPFYDKAKYSLEERIEANRLAELGGGEQ